VAALRGTLIALLMLLLAGPIATFIGAPKIADGLRALSIVPLIAAFANFDFRRAQRHYNFAPEAKVILISELCGLVGTIAAVLIVRDYTAIIYGLVARASAATLVSLLISSQSYAFGFSKELSLHLVRFGAPLLINGLLLFVATQSDRVMIARFLGVEALGRYSVALLLIYYPSAITMRFASAVYMPAIASQRDNREAETLVARELGGAAVLVSVAMAIGYSLAGPVLIDFIFGSEFKQDHLSVALIGLVTTWRLLKIAPTTTALAMGHTHLVLANNIIRLAGVAFSFFAVTMFGGLPSMLLGLIVGEIIANAGLTIMLNRTKGWHFSKDVRRYAMMALISISLAAWGFASDNKDSLLQSIVASAILLATIALAVQEWHLAPDIAARLRGRPNGNDPQPPIDS
jgi:O-antigen/teichoic acid export membrane protein